MWVAIWERVGRDVRGEKERERASPYRGPLGVQSPHRATEVRASGGSFCPIRPRHRKNKGEYTLARDGMASGRQHLQKTDVTAPKTREQQGHRSKTHKTRRPHFVPPSPTQDANATLTTRMQTVATQTTRIKCKHENPTAARVGIPETERRHGARPKKRNKGKEYDAPFPEEASAFELLQTFQVERLEARVGLDGERRGKEADEISVVRQRKRTARHHFFIYNMAASTKTN